MHNARTPRPRLARGMTVQSAGELRVAYCVVCGWTSAPAPYDVARLVACQTDSHRCERWTRRLREKGSGTDGR